jgi:hypothetical protein
VILFRSLLLTMVCQCVAAAAFAQGQAARVPAERSRIADAGLVVEIVDLTPRFLDFYHAAADADPETRWTIWSERYGFAAVPPTPEGMRIARTLLDQAWPRYADALPLIRRGAAAIEPPPLTMLRTVAGLLELEGPFELQLVVFVGAFDGNAFTAGQDDQPVVAVPVEMDAAERALVLAHEMTHAVHLVTAGLSGGWERSIAETIVQEGLAMHVTKAVAPGRDDRAYIEHSPGWYDAGMAGAGAILEGLLPELDKSDSDTVFRFTMGSGATGLEREAYLAGWLVVGEWLTRGQSLAEIARIPADAMSGVVRETMLALLATEWPRAAALSKSAAACRDRTR